MEYKKCTVCLATKSIDCFYRVKTRDTYTSACKECTNEKVRQYRMTEKGKEVAKKASRSYAKKNRQRSKYYELSRIYGLTKEEYESLREKQNFRCAICNTHEKEVTRSVLYVDHCHITNKVRGLLCQKCNQGIGLLKDSIENLNNAINYLKGNTND